MAELTQAGEIIETLMRERPEFQLRSGTGGLRSSEQHLFGRREVDTSGLERAAHPIAEGVLRYLVQVVRSGAKTLETGSGWSTAVFVAAGAYHTCVNPDATSNELVRSFLEAHGIGSDRLRFVTASSDLALPGMDASGDHAVVLIDGNHSHPFPLLDWHYCDRLLCVGAIVVLDNIEINSVRHVVEFLRGEPSYRYRFARWGCAVFEKVSEQRVMGWSDQRMNRKSKLGLKRWLLTLGESIRGGLVRWGVAETRVRKRSVPGE